MPITRRMGIDVRRPILALRLSPSGSSPSSTSSPAFSRRLWRSRARLLHPPFARVRSRPSCLDGCAGSRRQAPLRRTCQDARVQGPRTKPGVIRSGRRHVVIAASIGWLWMVEGQRPTGSDVLGALLTIAGAVVIVGAAAKRLSKRDLGCPKCIYRFRTTRPQRRDPRSRRNLSAAERCDSDIGRRALRRRDQVVANSVPDTQPHFSARHTRPYPNRTQVRGETLRRVSETPRARR
jgi:hypothetical protein